MSKKEQENPEEQENITDSTAGSDTSESNENLEPAEIVAKYEALVKELNEKYIRLFAEFDNFRRRTQKEKADLIKYGGEEIILSILPVIDDMERALAHHKGAKDSAPTSSDKHKPLMEGLDLILQKTKKILTSKGVEAMEPKGEVFDPELHDAITNIPATSEDMKGKVAEVIEKGYSLNGKVIRHAKVVVAN